MNLKKQRYFPLFLVFLLGLLSACNTKDESSAVWDYSNKDVVGAQPGIADNIDLDIYIDATTSMQGFAISNTTNYSQFLDQLEASALSAWKKTDAKFYKFGEIVRQVGRNDFLAAKNSPDFYHEQGIFMKTYIDSVVKRTDSKRLSVLITDLFQDEGDVNTMVDRFKEKCFANGVAVGILGIKSAFNGKVFDVDGFPNGYDLNSPERPFYAIMFGNSSNMELLFKSLKAQPFVKEGQFLIISDHIIQSYKPTVKRAPGERFNFLTPDTTNNEFGFIFDNSIKAGHFNVDIDITNNPSCADFLAENAEIVVYKKLIKGSKPTTKDGVPSDDIVIDKIHRSGNKLTANLTINNNAPGNSCSYAVYLKTNPINGLVVPEWIKSFSTDAPEPGSPSGAKTYNLEKLVSRLLVANASVTPTYLAKFYITINKK